jgi:HAE1 family hydrophobic/amphiphilic exporter-1
MALSLGEGAELRAPLAITVSFGLLLSTLLTLVVIPAVYAVVPSRVREGRAVDEGGTGFDAALAEETGP